MGRVALSREGGWGWAKCELVFPGFCTLAAFPGGFLLRVRAAVAESQPLSQNREIAVCSPLTSPCLFYSVSVGAAKNPAASLGVHPTAGAPSLTSRDGTSLSFVFLTLPAASRPHVCSRAPCFIVVCTHSGAPVFSLVARAFPGSRSQSALSQVPVRESGWLPSAGGHCFLAPEPGGSLPLPSVF